MKTFTYKKYKNCYFIVGSYLADEKAIAISIENKKEGLISTCTVYDTFWSYNEDVATIKNYSENSHMTDFLTKMKVVDEIIWREPCNSFVRDTLNTSNPQTIDTCLINKKVLKEYTKEWNYNV